jgi:hypothetical protein
MVYEEEVKRGKSVQRKSLLAERWIQLTVVVPVCELIREIHWVTVVLLQQPLVDEFSILDGDLHYQQKKECNRVSAVNQQLTSFPGHPIQVKLIVFFVPLRADTRPPLDI